jgi:lipopolysaccharide biosynthesis regulator YciM
VKALIQLEQDQEDNAVQSFSAAIYCKRKHALAAMMLGNIYQSRGDLVKASRNWRNALQSVDGKSDSDYVSDISDMTVARLRGMVTKQQALIEENGKPLT